MYVNGKNTLVKDNATTPDIVEALLNATPAAVNQCKGYVFKMIEKSGNPLVDAERCCRYIRANVKYKADGFSEQNIQLPGRMFKDTKQADCKSFSLAFVGMMEALGYDAGFRFASYKRNKIPTHVYNFVLCNGKKYIFDACIENLKESPRHTYIQDMKVQYLSAPAGAFDYAGYAKQLQDQGRSKAEIVKLLEEVKKRNEEIDKAIDTAPGRGKKLLLAPARIAFLALVRLNFRGLATKFLKLGVTEATDFWEGYGGDFDSLKKAIEAGKNKRAVLGQGSGSVGFYNESSYIYGPEGGGGGGEGAGAGDKLKEFAQYLGPASVIITAIVDLFKKKKIDDPEDLEGAKKDFNIPDAPPTKGFTMDFKPSPLVIGGIIGGLALVYFLVIKKKK